MANEPKKDKQEAQGPESTKDKQEAQGPEFVEMWLSADRFLQQYGQAKPRMVKASFDRPVKVKLPAKVLRSGRERGPDGRFVPFERWEHQKEDQFLTYRKPGEPLDPHPNKGGRSNQPAHAAYGPKQ